MLKIGYRVRPVTRYSVTRWHDEETLDGLCSGGSECCGEFDRADMADKVASALANQEPAGRVTLQCDPIYSATGDGPVHLSWAKETVIREDQNVEPAAGS